MTSFGHRQPTRGLRPAAACQSVAWVVLVCAGLLGGRARAEDWPSWRGPHGTGVSADAGLPFAWGPKENVRWRVPLPDRGNSTPVVWGDRVFVTQAVEREDRRTVMCFAKGDGKLLWQAGVTHAGREPTNGQNPYCSASAVTDGERVIAYFGSAGLYCYDAATGRELWRRDVGQVDSWQGSGSSPVLYEGLVVLNAGPGTEAVLIACDKRTGAVVWKLTPPGTPAKPPPAGASNGDATPPPGTDGLKPPRPPPGGFDDAMMAADPRGAGGFIGSWSTPILVRSGDRDELIVVHAHELTAYDPRTGRPLWTCKGLPEQAFASPAVGDGVLVATGHRVAGGGTRVTAVRLDGRGAAAGDVTAAHRLWQTDLPKDCVGSGVVAGGHVYLITQSGFVGCLDLATGKKQWEKRLPGQGRLAGSWSSIVLAGGRLLVPNQAGEVFVLRASPQFELLGQQPGSRGAPPPRGRRRRPRVPPHVRPATVMLRQAGQVIPRHPRSPGRHVGRMFRSRSSRCVRAYPCALAGHARATHHHARDRATGQHGPEPRTPRSLDGSSPGPTGQTVDAYTEDPVSRDRVAAARLVARWPRCRQRSLRAR
jgi:outer membrane protein assembly factor BamB